MHISSLFTAGILFIASAAAFAAPKAALITVSPGFELFEAFGHSAILIDGKTVYEFEGLAPSSIMAGGEPITNMNSLLLTGLPAVVTKSKLEDFQRRYTYARGGAVREIRIDQLNLPKKEVATLANELEKAAKTGKYDYNNFMSNCATMIRDQVLGALDKSIMSKFLETNNSTYRALVKESIDTAVKSNKKGAVLFPTAMFTRGPGVKMFEDMLTAKGGAPQLKNGADLDKSLNALNDILLDVAKIAAKNPQVVAAMMKLKESEAKMLPTLSATLTSFVTGNALDQALTDYDAMMTPARLRDGLLKVKIGKKALIDPKKSKILTLNANKQK